jgi:tRNA(fMet)-specific endonuclease VapC
VIYCLDTNTIIDAMRASFPHLTKHFENLSPDRIKIPSAVKAELLYGAERSARPQENRRRVEEFLVPYAILPFTDSTTYFYGRIRAHLAKKGYPIGPMDTVIAATVQANGATLVTNNTREFARVPGLQLEDWTKP